MNTVAIVGAGIGGIAAARTLRRAGVEIEIFDKGRGLGGRVATRRDGLLQFDHGAQYFTVRDPGFDAAIAPLRAQGLVQVWNGPFRTLLNGSFGSDPCEHAVREVAVPRMSMLPRQLARDLVQDLVRGVVVQCRVRVERLQRGGDGWWLGGRDSTGQALVRGPFSAVLLAVPVAQAHQLLTQSCLFGLAAAAAFTLRDSLRPCLCAMIAFERVVPEAEGGLFVTDEALAFAAHDGGKPGRNGTPNYVLQATPEWSLQRLESDPESSARELVAAFERALAVPLPAMVHCKGHRWRYAVASGTCVPDAAVVDLEHGWALASDALAGGLVEGGFRSGVAAAEGLLRAVQ